MSGPYILPEAEHLLADEVDFELKLRGQIVDRRETLEDKQRFLRRLMKEEKVERVGRKGKHLFKEEVVNINGKVEAISLELNRKFDRALVSRLRHCLIRAHSAVVEDEEDAREQIEVCRQVEQILKSFEQKIFMEADETIKDPIIPEKHSKGSGSKVGSSKNSQDKEGDENGDEDTGKEDARALEKQKELEKEWKEFILWKQDKLYDEAKTKCGEIQNVDERPPKSNKSHKSRSRHRESSESSDRRSPECNKNRKSLQKLGKQGRGESDRRPPECDKSRWSRRNVSQEREDRFSRGRASKGKDRRHKRYSSESSAERPKNRRSKDRLRRYAQSDSEDDSDCYRKSRLEMQKNRRDHRHSRNSRRSPSSAESDFNRRQYRKSRVENWDLNFSGDSRSIQVEDFLNRIQKLARHEGVSKEELLMNIHRRLKGEAYDWWFTREERLTSWKRFENEIRFRYGNPNRDRGIRAQIRELKQRKGETFIAYVTEVEKLNQCLQQPFSSRTLFELIWENMRPHYRSKLSVLDIDHLDDLIDINHKIDANDPTFYRPNQGNRNELHHLEIESDYSSPDEVPVNTLKPNQRSIKPVTSSKPAQKSSDQQKPSVAIDSFPQQRNLRRSSSVLCWNCRKVGHIFRECREPKQLFCYVCGNLGKTARNCDRDHSSLNQRKERNLNSTN